MLHVTAGLLGLPDSTRYVVIDLREANVWDHSTGATLDAINERYTEADVRDIATAIRKVATAFAAKAKG